MDGVTIVVEPDETDAVRDLHPVSVGVEALQGVMALRIRDDSMVMSLRGSGAIFMEHKASADRVCVLWSRGRRREDTV